jgi:hypothetical protein
VRTSIRIQNLLSAARRSASRRRTADGLLLLYHMAFPCSSSPHTEHCVGIGTSGVATLSVELPASVSVASRRWFQLQPISAGDAMQGVRLPSCRMASRSSLIYVESRLGSGTLGLIFEAPCHIAFPRSLGLDGVLSRHRKVTSPRLEPRRHIRDLAVAPLIFRRSNLCSCH